MKAICVLGLVLPMFKLLSEIKTVVLVLNELIIKYDAFGLITRFQCFLWLFFHLEIGSITSIKMIISANFLFKNLIWEYLSRKYTNGFAKSYGSYIFYSNIKTSSIHWSQMPYHLYSGICSLNVLSNFEYFLFCKF